MPWDIFCDGKFVSMPLEDMSWAVSTLEGRFPNNVPPRAIKMAAGRIRRENHWAAAD